MFKRLKKSSKKELCKQTIKFSDYREEIEKALSQKLELYPILGENDGFEIIEGFITLSIHREITNNLTAARPIIPAIGIVGKASGRIYTFALKRVLPNIEI